jgi:cytochrome c1
MDENIFTSLINGECKLNWSGIKGCNDSNFTPKYLNLQEVFKKNLKYVDAYGELCLNLEIVNDFFRGVFMKYVLILMMMLTSFGAMAKKEKCYTCDSKGKRKTINCGDVPSDCHGNYSAKKVADVECKKIKNKIKSDSKAGKVKSSKHKVHWCEELNGKKKIKTQSFHAISKEEALERAKTSLARCVDCQTTLTTDKSSLKESCKTEKVKDYFYCDPDTKSVISLGKITEAKAKEEAGGNKLYTSESKAKKAKSCKPEKTKEYFVCDPSKLVGVSVGQLTKEQAKEKGKNGPKLYTSAAKAKKDKSCKPEKTKEYFVCDPTTLEGVSVGQLTKEQAKEKGKNGPKLYTSAAKAKKDKSCKVIKVDSYVCVLNKKNKTSSKRK